LAFDHSHDVGFFHDENIFTAKHYLATRPFAEKHTVTHCDIELDSVARFITGTRSYSDNLAFLRLFLSGVGNDDAAGRFSSASMRRTRIRSCSGRSAISFSSKDLLLDLLLR